MTEAIPWILVIIGWLFVNHTSNRRELRKEGRAAVDGSKKQIVAIARDAVEYFTSDKHELASAIKSELEMLEVELERIPHFKQRSSLFVKYVEFQEVCTGSDFESHSRVIHAHNSETVKSVLRGRNALLQEIERHFTLQYC